MAINNVSTKIITGSNDLSAKLWNLNTGIFFIQKNILFNNKGALLLNLAG